ncbi:MAG: rRNA pseudouridine synthase, partial [Oscillospiraceae bacterium]|nr:rRNA pseudouridine synthase [Oscillospiraceae bacterium]
TEGFVLITDDGELAHKMLSPKSHVPKLYFCTLMDEWDESYPSKFASGMILEDGEKCLPAQFFPGKDKKEAFVVLSEGMFHQVKRMFEALGNKVVSLKRLQIGALPLDPDLKPGECREILHKEIDKLLEYFVFNCDSLSKNR